MKIFQLALFAVSAMLCSNSFADGGITVNDGAKIQAILSSISVVSVETGRMTLAERLASLGVNVQYLNYGKYEPDEIEISEGDLKPGDVDYQFFTSDPTGDVTRRCPVSGLFGFIKRGKSWLPNDRTSNFYAFNICKAPGN